MSPPDVSIILPVFDRDKALQRAVASVLGQTFNNFELIIIDDSSAEPVAAVLSEISDSRIRHFRHEVNKGAAAARNTGIKNAVGRYIAFLDSDDEWLPNKLLSETTAMELRPANQSASCARHFVANGLDGESWRRLLPVDMNWRKRLLTIGCDLSPGSTLFVRREIFDEVGLFDESMRRYEDWDWLLRYLSRYDIKIIEDTLAVIHLSSPPPSQMLQQSADIFLARWQTEAKSIRWSGPRRLRARMLIDQAKSQIFEKKYLVAFYNVVCALANWPFQRPGSAIAMVRYVKGIYPKRSW
tara:strand:- start:1522 stop:2415 length:894 start_codon:yes stop_codon:yes gene_type:complete